MQLISLLAASVYVQLRWIFMISRKQYYDTLDVTIYVTIGMIQSVLFIYATSFQSHLNTH